MSKFAVGDKVRYNGKAAAYRDGEKWPKSGDTGVVTGFVAHYTIVRLDNTARATNGSDDGWRFIDAWLERALRFRVGDRVKFVKSKDSSGEYLVGREGVITETINAYHDYIADFGDEYVGKGVSDDELDAAPPIKKLRFNVGDKVTLTGVTTGPTYWNGKNAVITDIIDYESSFDYSVNVEKDGTIAVRDSELSPFVPALRIGDKVRVVNTKRFRGFYSDGAEGVVESLDTDNAEFPIEVRLTKSSPKGGGCDAVGHHVHYAIDELEVIAEPAPAAKVVAEAPKAKFEKGDKVRLVGPEYALAGSVAIGDVGVVTGFREGGVIARFDDSEKPTNGNADGWWCFEKQLEKVASPKFIVGQRVKVACKTHGADCVYHDKVGVIERLDSGFDVRFDNGDKAWFSADDLVSVNNEKRQPKVGDRVKVRCNYLTYRPNEATGVIREENGRLVVRYDGGAWSDGFDVIGVDNIEILEYLDAPQNVAEAKPTILPIGTKVRMTAKGLAEACDNGWYDNHKVDAETIGVVERNDETDGMYTPYYVNFGNGVEWYVKADYIEVVPGEKRKFAVGDKVRLLNDFTYLTSGLVKGAVGVVTETFSEKLLVRFDEIEKPTNGWTSGWYIYRHENFELVAPAAKPVVRTIARSNLRFTRKDDRIVVEANGKRVASITVEELREMTDEMTKEGE